MASLFAKTVIHGIGTLATPSRANAPLRGNDLNAVIQIDGAAIAIDEDGWIISMGAEAAVFTEVHTTSDTFFYDARGALAVPGLVDCHTHPVFAGDRASEFELRNLGESYEAIHAAGGGIRASVERTRSALENASIAPQVRGHLDWMIAAGTTTAECKSGYALTLEHELASLRVLQDVAADHPIDIVTTLLAAHTVPVEFDGDPDRYIDEVAIPAALDARAQAGAAAADVFLERGSFNKDQAERYLVAAQSAGLDARLHADQFSDQGGIELAIAIGARSVDHLEALEPDSPRFNALAKSDVAAVLLPLSSLFLSRPFAPGRELVDAGAIVTIASDFNPGSSYGESLTLAMSLGAVGCRLRAGELLSACTTNAAWVIGRAERVGRLDVGYRGDVLLLDQPSLAHLPYHIGSPQISSVFVGGHEVQRGGASSV